MSRAKLFLLGPPRVELEDRPIQIQRRKVTALLIFLAVTGERHQRESLAALLWPESSQKRAHGSLRRHLSELNGVLGGDWLDVDREAVGLHHRVDLWLDVHQFQQHVAACQTHTHATHAVCAACLAPLTKAVDFYRDDFLSGFSLPNCPEFDEWQFFQAEGLRQTLGHALERLARVHILLVQPEAAIPYARRWLGLDRLHEPAHRLLMRLYAQTGQQAAALRQYRLCVQILEDELGIPPAAETTELFERIRSRHLIDDVVVERHRVDAGAVRHNLPAQTTPFVGRESELSELTQLCDDPDTRWVTILGPGGIGKTRLALELATRQTATYQHGVFFISLDSLSGLDQFVVAVANAVGFQLQGDERAPKRQLLDYLRHKNMLLLLDSFDQLLDGVDLVDEMLQVGPGLKILMTSQERPQHSGETVFTLDSLDFPTYETASEVLEYSAVRLFLRTAQRVRPGFKVGSTDLQYVARICRLVDGVPLGIVLAAAWIQVLSPAEIAAEITQSFNFLETELRDIPKRQRSMRALFDHAWQRLSKAERDVFMRLSVFRAGFTRQAAQSVAGTTLRTLTALLNKSLVVRESDGRYHIHELLRQYAEKQLEASEQTTATHDAHCTYYLDFLRQRETALSGRQQLTVLAELDTEFNNIRAAWHWAVGQRDYDAIDAVLEGLYRWHWMVRSRQQDVRALLRLAQEEWAPAPGQDPHPVWGRVLARVLDRQGPWMADPARARARAEKALSIAEERGHVAEIAFCLLTLGFATMSEFSLINLRKAIDYYEQSLDRYRALKDPFHMAQLLQDLGHCYRRLWQVDKALGFLHESLTLRREMGDMIGAGHCLRELGWAAYVAANAGEAETYWGEAYTIRCQVGDRQGIADSLFTLSLLSLTKGDWANGEAMIKDVLDIAQDIGSVHYERWALQSLAIVKSMAATQQGVVRHSQVSANTITPFEVILFHLLWTREDTSDELKWRLQRGFEVARQDIDQARCLPFAALFSAREGCQERAVTLLSLAFSFPAFKADWLSQLPLINDLVADLKASLPPEIFASAWERGQALNLAETVVQIMTEL